MSVDVRTPGQRSVARIPFDLAAMDAHADWRRDISWPLSYEKRRELLLKMADRLASEVDSLDPGPLRDAALVALPGMTNQASMLVSAAALVEAARQQSLTIDGGPPELAMLAGRESATGKFTPGSFLAPARPRLASLRRLARTASWSSFRTLPRAVMRPAAIVLAHNSGLRAYVKKTNTPAYFFPVEQLLSTASGPVISEPGDGIAELAARLASQVGAASGFAHDIGAKFQQLLERRFTDSIALASSHLAQARTLKHRPAEIWTGNLGSSAARSVALVTRERGGSVALFDHGGGTATAAPSRQRAVRELTFANRIVLATATAADQSRKEWNTLPEFDRYGTTFAAGVGEPAMRDVPWQGSVATQVLYLPTPLLGFRETLPPLLPDPIALDWQLRLAQTLKRLVADVYARPHPEGALPADRHPIGGVLPLAMGAYTDVIRNVGRFIFEYPHSTAFWQALCTDRPVIYIDLGLSSLSDAAAGIIRRRCTVLQVAYDLRNRPQVDEDELSEAVRGGQSQADPSEIRAFLIGTNP